MLRLLIWLLVWCAASCLAAAEPSPPNLIVNGGFEDGADGPAGWRFGSARMEIFRAGRSPNAASGRLAARIECSSAAMSGYWSQAVKVKPHTRYRLSVKVWLASGKALVQARGKSFDARLYLTTPDDNPLVPVFLPVKWAGGVCEASRWTTHALEFATRDETAVSVHLGAYFSAGVMNFDDVELCEIK
jgi:hypothetical protein